MPNVQDTYAKEILRAVLGGRFNDDRQATQRRQAPNAASQVIDGVIDLRIAVEITSGTAKHIAGEAALRAQHPLPFKLLVVVPGNAANDATAAELARITLAYSIDTSQFRVFALSGRASDLRYQEDRQRLLAELRSWPIP